MTQTFAMKLIPALMLLGFAGTASAAGFAIQNQAGSGTGNAFAGAAATAEDAGTIFLTRLAWPVCRKDTTFPCPARC